MKITLSIIFSIILSLPSYSYSSKHHSTKPQTEHKFKGFSCKRIPCPQDRGICNVDNICYCFKGYVTHLPEFQYLLTGKDVTEVQIDANNLKDVYQCNYEQRAQMVAFLLEFIISFGIGHMYIGNYLLGLIKFSACSVLIISFLSSGFIVKKINLFRKLWVAPFIQVLSILIFSGWQIIDAILFGLNLYKDGNGVELKQW